MKGKLALEVDRGDCRGRVGDWVGLGVKGERTRKIESQSFGPEPFENFGTGFYFRSARLVRPSIRPSVNPHNSHASRARWFRAFAGSRRERKGFLVAFDVRSCS